MRHHVDNIIHEAKGVLAMKLSINDFLKTLLDKPYPITVNAIIENQTYKVKFTITKSKSPSGYVINHCIIEPKGSSEFTLSESQAIKELLIELRSVDGDAQEKIREILRKDYDFYISDYTDSKSGFTELDFDNLVDKGIIAIN